VKARKAPRAQAEARTLAMPWGSVDVEFKRPVSGAPAARSEGLIPKPWVPDLSKTCGGCGQKAVTDGRCTICGTVKKEGTA
jgi:hypothetical protein